MTRLEIAERKLERLEKEYEQAIVDCVGHVKLANGQPMNDKRNGASWFKKNEAKHNKANRLREEVEKQRERVEYLRNAKEYMAKGRTKNGFGMRLTRDNVDNIKKYIEDYENGVELTMTVTRATLNRYKRFVREMENEQELIIPDGIKKLIDDGKLTQWKKHPTIFFVNGFRKVAISIVDGKVGITARYWPNNDEEMEYVEKLIENIA